MIGERREPGASGLRDPSTKIKITTAQLLVMILSFQQQRWEQLYVLPKHESIPRTLVKLK